MTGLNVCLPTWQKEWLWEGPTSLSNLKSLGSEYFQPLKSGKWNNCQTYYLRAQFNYIHIMRQAGSSPTWLAVTCNIKELVTEPSYSDQKQVGGGASGLLPIASFSSWNGHGKPCLHHCGFPHVLTYSMWHLKIYQIGPPLWTFCSMCYIYCLVEPLLPGN